MLTANDVTVSQFRRNEEFGYFQCEKNGYREFLQNPEEAEKQFSENLNGFCCVVAAWERVVASARHELA